MAPGTVLFTSAHGSTSAFSAACRAQAHMVQCQSTLVLRGGALESAPCSVGLVGYHQTTRRLSPVLVSQPVWLDQGGSRLGAGST